MSEASEPGPVPAGRTDPYIGRSVGNYRIERLIGKGGMGAVYRLQHEKLPGTLAALKILFNRSGESAAQRFEQEAVVASAVGSHRVVRPLDIGRLDDGTPYIIMEYVDGHSLADELRQSGAMEPAVALRVALRVADTMAIAHDKGIVHRDLKPANLMLAREAGDDFSVKVLDFGVARASGALKLAETAQNMLIGTPGYMSPEAVTGAEVDGRSDVFSLGVILFEMVTESLPFPAPTAQAAMANVLTLEAPPASSRRPSDKSPLPPELDDLVASTLVKHAAERPTMSELRDRLDQLLSLVAPGMSPPASLFAPRPASVSLSSGPSPLPSAAAVRSLRPGVETGASLAVPRKSRVGLYVGAALAVALAAGIGWTASRRRAPSEPPPSPVTSPAVAAPAAAPAPPPAAAAIPAPAAERAPSPATASAQPPPAAPPPPTAEGAARGPRGDAARARPQPTRTRPAAGAPEPERKTAREVLDNPFDAK